MAEAERELLDSLSKRRKAFRESFKLQTFTEGERRDEGTDSIMTTSLGSTQGSDDLLEVMKERRKKRKAMLPHLDSSLPVNQALKPTGSLPPLTSTVIEQEQDLSELPAVGGSNVRRLKAIREQIRSTRFDNLPSSMPQHQKPLSETTPPISIGFGIDASNRWRTLSANMTEVKNKVVEQKSIEFFTGSPTPVHHYQEREETDMREVTTIEEDRDVMGQGEREEEERDRSALLDEQAVPLSENEQPDDVIRVQKYGLPRYIPYQERMDREKEIYFVPSREQVPLVEKTPGQAQPVFLEDAGLHTGLRPNVTIGNLATLENRLLRRPDKGQGWFGEDGMLLTKPYSLKELVTRPLIIAEDEQQRLVHHEPEMNVQSRYYTNKKDDNCSDIYQLELFLGQIQFEHHPLFSVEHVLSSALQRQCEQYHATDRGRLIEQYRQKLQALQYSIHSLQQKQGNLENSTELEDTQKELEDTSKQIQHYSQQIRSIRQQIKQISCTDYKLVLSILETWKEIKRVREEQSYASTNVQLTVHRITTDAVFEEAQLQRDIDDELKERKEDFEIANTDHKMRYKSELADWKAYEKARRKAIRQQARQESSQTQPPSTTEVDPSSQTETASLISIPPERPRPIAPPSFNEPHVRQELLEYYHQCHCKPGEPKLIPHLLLNYPITQQTPRDEQHRRDAIERTKYKIKVLYNNKEVCATNECSLHSDFTVHFNEVLKVNVVEWPYSIELQFIDTSSLLPVIVAHLYVPIPDSSQTSTTACKEKYQFSSNQRSKFDHTAVGSGHIHPLLPKNGELITSGHMTITVCWGEREDRQALCPPGIGQNQRSSKLDSIAHVGVIGVNNVHNIKKWIEEAHLDPNDPRNWELLQLAESIPSTQEETSYFRLIKIDEDALFVEEEEFQNNRRFTLLHMREQGHPALKGQCIPMNEEGITDSLWKSVHDYKPYSLAELPVSIFGNFYEGRREKRLRYLNEVRERVLKQRGTHPQSELTLEDVIHEELIPNMGTLGKTLLDFFSPHRPLKPKRKVRHRPKPQNVHVSTCDVTVRVVRAINVPIRGDEEEDCGLCQDWRGDWEEGKDKILVQSFVEVKFGKEKDRTSSAYGPHPHWNEEIILPFNPPDNDFSPASLQKISDELQIHLYDEVTVDLLRDERQRGTNVHQRFDKKWLGSLSIPFSTLHAQSRIEGTFQLDTPPIILGYHPPPNNSSLSGEASKTYIQLFISIEPTLSMLAPISDKFDSAEDSLLLERGRKWLKSLREKFPSRNYTATALDINGKNVFLTRFIRPQNPPASLIPQDYQTLQGLNLLHCMEQLAWCVSLIPSLPDAILFSGTCDIWTTSDLFLNMLGGDEEEHAVLLCNYFLYLGQSAWVVLGTAIPEGPTAYVLTPHPTLTGSYILWNPSSGKYFLNTLAHIPLTSIGCLVNNENIWGNIQEWDHPSRVTFDLQSNKKWSAIFPTNMEPLESIQRDILEYPETDPIKIQQLQTRIDQLVHDYIEQLRLHHITKWNRHCCRLLLNLLTQLEEKPYCSQDISLEHRRQLQESFRGFKITGYPLHLRYNDTTQLLRAVESTGLHLCEHERVEFAMAVHIHAYPNDILSVWLYLATLLHI